MSGTLERGELDPSSIYSSSLLIELGVPGFDLGRLVAQERNEERIKVLQSQLGELYVNTAVEFVADLSDPDSVAQAYIDVGRRKRKSSDNHIQHRTDEANKLKYLTNGWLLANLAEVVVSEHPHPRGLSRNWFRPKEVNSHFPPAKKNDPKMWAEAIAARVAVRDALDQRSKESWIPGRRHRTRLKPNVVSTGYGAYERALFDLELPPDHAGWLGIGYRLRADQLDLPSLGLNTALAASRFIRRAPDKLKGLINPSDPSTFISIYGLAHKLHDIHEPLDPDDPSNARNQAKPKEKEGKLQLPWSMQSLLTLERRDTITVPDKVAIGKLALWASQAVSTHRNSNL